MTYFIMFGVFALEFSFLFRMSEDIRVEGEGGALNTQSHAQLELDGGKVNTCLRQLPWAFTVS